MRTRLLLLAAALVAFGASLGSGFHFDDYAIFPDPAITAPSGWMQIWTLRQTRPLTYLTFWLNYQIGGGDPLGYHLLNLALHLGVVLLLYECLRRLMPEAAAVIATAIFAVHPIQAEAVDYIWGRSIVLATLFCLASLHAWLEERPWTAVAWFAAALLAKEEVAAFPLVLLLFNRKRIAPVASMLALSIVAAARVVYAAQVTPGAPIALQAGITPWKYFLAQGPVVLRYFRLLLVPYGFTVDPDIGVPPAWLGLLAWLAIVLIAVTAWRYSKWFLAGLILLVPSCTIFPAADLSADRRLYLPMLGFAAAAGYLLARAKPRAIAIAAVAVLALVSVSRTMVWMSERSLWQEAVDRAPDKVRPKIQLARALPASAALELLNRARESAPDDPSISAEIGKTLLSEGQPDAALTEFGRALALDPRNALYVNNRGVALAALGQTQAARADFQRALQMDPHLTEAKQNLRKLTAR
jgi:hypothetical protein